MHEIGAYVSLFSFYFSKITPTKGPVCRVSSIASNPYGSCSVRRWHRAAQLLQTMFHPCLGRGRVREWDAGQGSRGRLNCISRNVQALPLEAGDVTSFGKS